MSSEMASFPRGIAPDLLLSQVRNTMPYLWEALGVAMAERFPPAKLVLETPDLTSRKLDHFEYFRLCVSAHYLTCGTPVPTDVDNQIRHKLWPAGLPLETALAMASLVVDSRQWDFRTVSERNEIGAFGTPQASDWIAGHRGEWFTLAAGAYCALLRYSSQEAKLKREELSTEIRAEVSRHSEVFGSLWRAEDGLGCLRASAIIAHNFGDLDRVMDMWELSFADPLRLECYKLTAQPFDSDRKLRHLGRLWVAGELYKSAIGDTSMASENHRHFALRKPRSLRRRREFLIPLGPFFDSWGETVAKGLANPEGMPSEDSLEVIAALKHGWDRLPKTVGYGRALRAFYSLHPELDRSDQTQNPYRQATLELSREEFERTWSRAALAHMDEIPSRAE